MSTDPVDTVLLALSQRQPIDLPAAVVVAHPDDETIGVGPFLRLFRRLRLIHVTDGAPRNLQDARAMGFDSCEAYARARTQELHAALRAGGVTLPPSSPALALGVPDQGAS
ncbi:MAG TPA: PIG-L family deacetylase, partial [Rhodopila sp.]|nr:PIG-L family deacetylase [Rhodopila sp.]